MYHYLWGMYMAYRLYEYCTFAEFIYAVGSRVKGVYNWYYTPPQIEASSDPDVDWVLVSDE